MSLVRRAHSVVAAMFLLAACESAPPAEPLEGSFLQGTWAGASWTADATLVRRQGQDTLIIGGSSPRGAGMAQHWLYGGVAVSGPGEYPLPAGAFAFRYLVGGDGITATYASQSERLVIEELTETRVRGRLVFDAAFANGLHTPAGQTARFQADFSGSLTWVH